MKSLLLLLPASMAAALPHQRLQARQESLAEIVSVTEAVEAVDSAVTEAVDPAVTSAVDALDTAQETEINTDFVTILFSSIPSEDDEAPTQDVANLPENTAVPDDTATASASGNTINALRNTESTAGAEDTVSTEALATEAAPQSTTDAAILGNGPGNSSGNIVAPPPDGNVAQNTPNAPENVAVPTPTASPSLRFLNVPSFNTVNNANPTPTLPTGQDTGVVQGVDPNVGQGVGQIGEGVAPPNSAPVVPPTQLLRLLSLPTNAIPANPEPEQGLPAEVTPLGDAPRETAAETAQVGDAGTGVVENAVSGEATPPDTALGAVDTAIASVGAPNSEVNLGVATQEGEVVTQTGVATQGEAALTTQNVNALNLDNESQLTQVADTVAGTSETAVLESADIANILGASSGAEVADLPVETGLASADQPVETTTDATDAAIGDVTATDAVTDVVTDIATGTTTEAVSEATDTAPSINTDSAVANATRSALTITGTAAPATVTLPMGIFSVKNLNPFPLDGGVGETAVTDVASDVATDVANDVVQESASEAVTEAATETGGELQIAEATDSAAESAFGSETAELGIAAVTETATAAGVTPDETAAQETATEETAAGTTVATENAVSVVETAVISETTEVGPTSAVDIAADTATVEAEQLRDEPSATTLATLVASVTQQQDTAGITPDPVQQGQAVVPEQPDIESLSLFHELGLGSLGQRDVGSGSADTTEDTEADADTETDNQDNSLGVISADKHDSANVVVTAENDSMPQYGSASTVRLGWTHISLAMALGYLLM